MATTANEVQQAIQALQNFENQIQDAITNVNDKADALLSDPSQPDALSQYEQLAAEREAFVSVPWNSTAQGLITTLNNAYNDAPLSVQQSLKTDYDNVKNKAGQLVTTGKFQKNDTLPKVLAAIQKAKEDGNKTNSNLTEDPDTPGSDANSGTGGNLAAGEGTENQTADNYLTGSADDDTNRDPGTTVAGASDTENLFANNVYGDAAQKNISTYLGLGEGNTSVEGGNTRTDTNSPPRPGVRLQNPLGNFGSYTYQISLYMISPESYNAFILSQRQNIYANPNGVFLLAQSGGINNEKSQRAVGFDLDYYIDDLKIVSNISGKATTTATNISEFSFTIYEPYGFSFLSNLRRANLAMCKTSSLRNMDANTNPMKQFFVIGLRFQGYDIEGNLITSDQFRNDDPTNPYRGLAEKFFDIKITGMKFKLDGKMSTYHCTAASCPPGQAFGISRGRIDHRLTVTSDNVYDALVGTEGLLTKINAQQKELATKEGPNGKPAIRVPNEYAVKFIGNSEIIQKASIVNQADLDKFRLPMSNAKKTSESTDSKALDSRPDTSKRTFTYDNSTPITMAVNDIIKNSDYMVSALKVLYSETLEPGDDDEEKNSKNVTIAWYTLSAELEPIAWDDILNDWAYKITFIIEPYQIPNIVSPYKGKAPVYYGPHKRYEYWYTGKNTEVISFEQQLDNAYVNVAIAADGTVPSVRDSGASMKSGLRENESHTGSRDIGQEAQNSVLTSLYSPKDWAEPKITIMGDPDFLIQDSSTAVGDVYNAFYGKDGYTINPNGGQVFIEINFKEGIDYDHNKGLMSLNDSIVFWVDTNKLPADIKEKIKGIVFMVIKVTSTFSKGKFTQVLDMRTFQFPQRDNAPSTTATASDTTAGAREGNTQAQPGGTNTTTSNTKTSSVGDTMKDPEVVVSNAAEAEAASASFDDFIPNNANVQVTAVSVATSPVANALIVTTVAGVQSDTTSILGNSVQAVDIKTVVADDDGTIDVKNQAIVTSASDANNPDAGRPTDLNTDSGSIIPKNQSSGSPSSDIGIVPYSDE